MYRKRNRIAAYRARLLGELIRRLTQSPERIELNNYRLHLPALLPISNISQGIFVFNVQSRATALIIALSGLVAALRQIKFGILPIIRKEIRAAIKI